jgi:hypothetical protein
MDEIVIGEKKYISSKQAAKATGYAKDYIGQLCREGRVPARLVGRSWYVLESAIQDHRFGDVKDGPVETEKKTAYPAEPALQSTWESPRYEASKAEPLPSVNILRSKEPDAAQRLEDTWQAWFDRFEHVAETVEPEAPLEKKQEDLRVQVDIEPEQPEPAQQEPEHDTVVPVHAVYEVEAQLPPEEIIPRYATQAAPKDEVREVRRIGGHKRVFMAVQISGMLFAIIAAVTAALGSGYFDSYVLSDSPVSLMAGVVLYNK